MCRSQQTHAKWYKMRKTIVLSDSDVCMRMCVWWWCADVRMCGCAFKFEFVRSHRGGDMEHIKCDAKRFEMIKRSITLFALRLSLTNLCTRSMTNPSYDNDIQRTQQKPPQLRWIVSHFSWTLLRFSSPSFMERMTIKLYLTRNDFFILSIYCIPLFNAIAIV